MYGEMGKEAKGQSIRIIYLAATAAGATGTTATCAARGAGAILELSGAGGSLVGSKTISTFMGRSLQEDKTESAASDEAQRAMGLVEEVTPDSLPSTRRALYCVKAT